MRDFTNMKSLSNTPNQHVAETRHVFHSSHHRASNVPSRLRNTLDATLWRHRSRIRKWQHRYCHSYVRRFMQKSTVSVRKRQCDHLQKCLLDRMSSQRDGFQSIFGILGRSPRIEHHERFVQPTVERRRLQQY